MDYLFWPDHKESTENDGITDVHALRFGMKNGLTLNRDLRFNNPTPGWMQYNLETHSITLGAFDAPAFHPDAHGIIPKSMERMYRDADDMQREPLPKKR